MACRSLPDACGFRTERAGWIHPRLMVQLGLILIAPLTYFIFFFFSSSRRHTRCGRDWGSDVCSSDLLQSFLESSSLLFNTQTFLLHTLAFFLHSFSFVFPFLSLGFDRTRRNGRRTTGRRFSCRAQTKDRKSACRERV